MGLNTDGCLLEGFRVATANSPFTYLPRTYVIDQGALDAINSQLEYMVWVGGQTAGADGIEISDPALTFHWTRNNGKLTRFDWDGFSRRWSTKPGTGQSSVGVLSNSPRVVVPPPDSSISASEAPFSIYMGSPTRIRTFIVSIVATSTSFGDPPAGTVEISADKGELNWGTADLTSSLAGQTVYAAQQAFFDRQKVKGRVGMLPSIPSDSYALFLNPIPGIGQVPRIRIGYRAYLTALQVSTEAELGSVVEGTVQYSADTGRLKFSVSDIKAYPGELIYYDGVELGTFTLNRYAVGVTDAVWPVAAGTAQIFVGLSDATRYVVYSELAGTKYYYDIVLGSGVSPTRPPNGHVYINTDTGYFYIPNSDPSIYRGATIYALDTVHVFEHGVALQFFRSAANGTGSPAPDFKEIWTVSNQTVVDGLIGSPFSVLPTTPLVDSSLIYRVEVGTGGGSFVGGLVDGANPTKLGNGYLLDLDQRFVKMTTRKAVTIVLPTPASAVKLPDAAISSFGFQAMKNGTAIMAGTDFTFNADTGMAEFTMPIGQNDPRNVLGVSGVVELPSAFVVPTGTFSVSQGGKQLLVASGPNAGVYTVLTTGTTTERLLVAEKFIVAGATTVDVRGVVEIIADRVWRSFKPPIRKVVLYRDGGTGSFTAVGQDKFSVLASNGQVNLTDPVKPGEQIRIEYTSLDSTDGVTVVPTTRTEFAGFKIRQEVASYVPGTAMVAFNPGSKTVLIERGISLYVNGVTVDPSGYTFTAPSTITLNAAITTEQVVLDYWVAESPGGNTNFSVLYTPIDLDLPTITAGSVSTVFNGDQSFLISGCPILIDNVSVALVAGSVYDSVTDTTTVTFSPTPYIGTDVNSVFKTAQSVDKTYAVNESLTPDILPKGSTTLTLFGATSYPEGTIVFLDDDPYLVVNSTQSGGVTKITLASSAVRNYIVPVVRRSVRPVLQSTQDVQTAQPAHVGYAPLLFKIPISGTPVLLVQGVDFTMADGGLIRLSAGLIYGDTLYACYVARMNQPAGTVFTFNYATIIAPNLANGLIGQKLISSYNLYNPDTFYFRAEPVLTFIPEVMEEIGKGSGTTSGPATANVSSMVSKDYGNPSLWFDEQHWRNVDLVMVRLLKYFNDQIDRYEDILACVDGRVVGGTSGRFRFDGNTSGNQRASYTEVRNDIDDQIRLFDKLVLTGFVSFTRAPVYGAMWDYNRYSRLFPIMQPKATVAFGDPDGYGTVLGSFAVSNLTSVGTTFSTTPSRAKYVAANAARTVVLVASINGSSDYLVPPFYSAQQVLLYPPDGSAPTSATITSLAVVPPDWVGPATLATMLPSLPSLIPPPVFMLLYLSAPAPDYFGGVAADVSSTSYAGVRFYRFGRHVSVNNDSGEVLNAQDPDDPPSPALVGNELVDADVFYTNKDTAPRRIPALDGSELTDSGSVSNPPLTYRNELDLCQRELYGLSFVGVGTTVINLYTPYIRSSVGLTIMVGMTVHFLTGTNAGQVRTIASTFSGGFVLNSDVTFDSSPEDIHIDAWGVTPPQNGSGTTLGISSQMTGVSFSFNVGTSVHITTGTNTGSSIIVTAVAGTHAFDFSPSIWFDPIEANMYVPVHVGDLRDIISNEVNLIRYDTTNSPSGGFIGGLNAEIISAMAIAANLGSSVINSTGSVSGAVLMDSSQTFAGVTTSCCVVIPSGANLGVYKVASAISGMLTVESSDPFAPFPSSDSVTYSVINPWSFWTPKQVQFLAKFVRESLTAAANASAWFAAIIYAGVANRVAAITGRQTYLSDATIAVADILVNSDSMYDMRYLLIQQRIDKKDGFLTKINQAASKRADDAVKLVANQKKALLLEGMV
jgi:hypothetical protein